MSVASPIIFACEYDGVSNLVPISNQNFINQDTNTQTVVTAWINRYTQELIGAVNNAGIEIRQAAKNFIYHIQLSAALVEALQREYEIQLASVQYCGDLLAPARANAIEAAKDSGGVLFEEIVLAFHSKLAEEALAELAVYSVVSFSEAPLAVIVAASVSVANVIIARARYKGGEIEQLFANLGGAFYDRRIAVKRVINGSSMPTGEVYTLKDGKEILEYRGTCRIFEGDQIWSTADRAGTFFTFLRPEPESPLMLVKYDVQGLEISRTEVPTLIDGAATIGFLMVFTFEDNSALLLYQTGSHNYVTSGPSQAYNGLGVAYVDPYGSIVDAKLIASGAPLYQPPGFIAEGSSYVSFFGNDNPRYRSGGDGVFTVCYYRTSYHTDGSIIDISYIAQKISVKPFALLDSSALTTSCRSRYSSARGDGPITITLSDPAKTQVNLEWRVLPHIMFISTPIFKAATPQQKTSIIMPGSSNNPFATQTSNLVSTPADNSQSLICLDPTVDSQIQITPNPNSITVVTGFDDKAKLNFNAFPQVNKLEELKARIVPISYNNYFPQDFINGLVPNSVLYGEGQRRRRDSSNTTELTSSNSSYALLRLPDNQTIVLSPISAERLIATVIKPTTESGEPHSQSPIPTWAFYVIGAAGLSALVIAILCMRIRKRETVQGLPQQPEVVLTLGVLIETQIEGAQSVEHPNTIQSLPKAEMLSSEIEEDLYFDCIDNEDTISHSLANMSDIPFVNSTEMDTWECTQVNLDQLTCAHHSDSNIRIVTKYNRADTWYDCMEDLYQCTEFEKDGLHIRQCVGEKSEYVEYDPGKLIVEPISTTAALIQATGSGFFMGAFPEAVGDTLEHTGLLNHERAQQAKFAVNAAIILAVGSWLASGASIVTTTMLKYFGVSDSKARIMGNTVSFFVNTGMNVTPIAVAAAGVNHLAAYVGCRAEKCVVDMFVPQPSKTALCS